MKSRIERNYTRARFTGNLFRWTVTREDGEKVYCETREDARAIARQWREDAKTLEASRTDLYAMA